MKAFTDINQSKKLAAILPIESADMHWQYIDEDNGQLQWFCLPKDFSINQHGSFPCWSLAALLDVSPREMRLLKSVTNDTYHCDCPKCHVDKWYDNPIDTCVEMIESLHKKMVYDFNNYRENE